MYGNVCVNTGAHLGQRLGFPGVGATGCSELPDMGVTNQPGSSGRAIHTP